ncbi:WxL domain-containing protein [Carnobacterium gallinarum]|uniref:WxL domain-containing protein n=1 Tax=Carnobacterium gallinarum TaxID=2749 RepID=UPI0005518568|nr:WxL domain-containing protein [Carnobacterium gallinarum]
MKQVKILITSVVLVSSLTLGMTSGIAKAADTADSKSHILFKSDKSPTHPVDPTDPNDPNPTHPVDPTDPSNPGTNHSGPLSLDFTSSIEFGKQIISASVATYNAKNEHPFVQVTDKRGTGTGWNLTAAASEFKSLDGKKFLKGAELILANGDAISTTTNVSKEPEVVKVDFNNTDSHQVMKADEDEGRGTWEDAWMGVENNNSNVQLKVLPGSADAGITYYSTIVWQLADAPK